MQQVRGRVGPADALPAVGVDPGGDLVAQRDLAFAQMPAVQREAAVDLRVDHLEAEAVADEFARVADLAAHLAVEGRLVEHDHDRVLVVDFVDLVAELARRR